MRSLTEDYLSSLLYDTEEAAMLRQIGEFCGREQLFEKQRPQILQSMRHVAIVESTESSNRIEGVEVPRDVLEDLIAKNKRPTNRSEEEVAGYRDALELIHQSWGEMPLSVDVVLQLHTWLYRYHPSEGGRFKSTDNQIVDRDKDGQVVRVRFEATPAVETPQAMADLFSRLNEATERKADPLILIPLTILDFLCIHPFSDGNGRVARLLTLLLLYKAGYSLGRYISMERVIEESKETYYESLETSSQRWHLGEHDSGPWRRYFWGVLLRAYREYEERIGRLDAGRGSKSQRVRDAVERKVMPFKLSEIERDCPGVSRDTIRNVLRELRDAGLLVAEGRGRGAKWRRVA